MDDMNDIIEVSGNGKYRVRLEMMQNSKSFNPRKDRDSNLTNVITPKGQVWINVDKDGGPLQDGWDRLIGNYNKSEAVKIFMIWARVFHGITVVEDRPHDGSWSLWYVTPEKLAETPWPAERIIAAEIKEYRSWAEGDVYGVIVEKRVVLVPRDAEDREDSDLDLDDETVTWKTVEDCWGYIGHEYATSTAKEMFEPYAKENAK